LVVIFIFLINILFSLGYTEFKKEIVYEFYLLLGLLCAFCLLIVSCRNLFLFFILVEGVSFLLIGAICFSNTKTSFEVATKFFVLSGFFTLIGLLGALIIYSLIHTLDYRLLNIVSSDLFFKNLEFLNYFELKLLSVGVILIVCSVLFKLGAFPFHVYVADLAGECLYPLLYFFLIPLKLVFFFVLTLFYFIFVHLYVQFGYIMLFSGLSSILVGAKSAFGENELKRFLAFTSINQFGFPLLALSVPSAAAVGAAYIFIFVYCLSMVLFLFVPMQCFTKNNREAFIYLNHFAYYSNFDLNFFNYKNLIPGDKEDFTAHLINNKHYFGYQFKTIILIFSFIGIPPFLGFGAKFMIFYCLILFHHYFIVLLVLLISLISAAYYLNLIYKIFNKKEGTTIFSLDEAFLKFRPFKFLQYIYNFFFIVFIISGFYILDTAVLLWVIVNLISSI
jgi:NADH:ubiquinone oxidoreductase subunit 2 (subunit N)